MILLGLAVPAEPSIGAWMTFWNPKSVESFRKRSGQIQEILPEWFNLKADGTVQHSGASTPELRATILKQKSAKLRVLGMISNYGEDGFDPKRISLVLATQESRRKHASDLAKKVRLDDLDGLDLDYESFPSTEKVRFNLFLTELRAQLRSKHLSITVHAKETPDGTWDPAKAQDWKAIGHVADSVRIMTYDFSYSTGEPGAIAPNDWVERVMTFAKSRIPVRKLRLGVAAYGYDWNTKPAKSLTFDDFDATGAEPDPKSGERVKGLVRFSGAEAMKLKLSLAKKLGIPGVCFWYLGSEDPSIWNP
jgi:spore germination protein YaaH